MQFSTARNVQFSSAVDTARLAQSATRGQCPCTLARQPLLFRPRSSTPIISSKNCMSTSSSSDRSSLDRFHLNGKVERSHLTDRTEFYSEVDPSDPNLKAKFAAWERFYNTQRPHGAHGGRTPAEKLQALQEAVPLLPDHEGFWNSGERVFPRRVENAYRRRR